jgi:multicomponent Na+:H+ antiporter subunit E
MKWLVGMIGFFLFYVKEVLVANVIIAWDILTPVSRARPGFVELELGELSEFQVLVLTNLITMTPGTLSFEMSADSRRLLVHVMYLPEQPEELQQHLLQRYLEPVKRLF